MAHEAILSEADREFFSIVAESAFCNPFAERRAELDARLVGHPIDPFSEAHLPELTAILSARIGGLEARGMAHLRRLGGVDRELMRTVFLFEVYHQYYAEFDRLILDQVASGDASAPVPFGKDVLDRLRRRGFDSAETVRYAGIFYQLRRAYHFIVRGLVGGSASMRALRRQLWDGVFTRDVRLFDRYLWNRMEDFSTLLLGETGTGKGAAAAAIGRSSYIPFDPKRGCYVESFTRGFTALNLSQFPESLIESELFGHRKGAFTGAIEAHEGVLARCSAHGAIFLDEIGDVSVPIQIKLLQVLQDRAFCPVGSHQPARFRGRVIAATNRPLETLRRRGLFRDDFYYRLCSHEIRVPPLRERLREAPEELGELIAHMLSGMVGAQAPDLAREVETGLEACLPRNYPWPGNVRELEQAVRRMLLTGQYSGSAAEATRGALDELMDGIESETLDADAVLGGYCALLYESSGNYEEVARKTGLDRRTAKKYARLGLRKTM